jgi:hypothetical protein
MTMREVPGGQTALYDKNNYKGINRSSTMVAINIEVRQENKTKIIYI